MIIGETRGAGGDRFAAYLLTVDAKQSAQIGASRGVLAVTLAGQIAELAARGARGRSRHPLSHVWASPAPDGHPWTARDWARFWKGYESEFDLLNQPWTEVVHTKAGREHRHRVYLLVRRDGRCIPAPHGRRRQEYLARRTEFERGEAMVAGRHNRAVHRRLVREGRHDVAAAMGRAGLLTCARPAAVSSAQRRQAERTGLAVSAVTDRLWAAWRTSDSWVGFRTAVEHDGYGVYSGDRAIVVRDPAGGVHGLRQTLDQAARDRGLPGIRVGDLKMATGEEMALPALPRRARKSRTVDPVVTFQASMQGYEVRQHRTQRRAWLDVLRRGDYDTSWLTRSTGVEVTDVRPLPGHQMVVVTLAGGAEIVDRFRSLRYVGPASVLSRDQWRTILLDRGWLPEEPNLDRGETKDDWNSIANIGHGRTMDSG